jgi:hypothetical protein
MKIAITYSITKNLELAKRHREEHAILKDKGVLGSDKRMDKNIDTGGRVVILDWKTKQEVFSTAIRSAMGIDYSDEMFYIASRKDNAIYVVDHSLRAKKSIGNRNFNDLHSLVRTNSGLMLTSSGIDSIIEVDLNGNSLWMWCAVENGFNLNPIGDIRVIDKTADHRMLDYSTLTQTTHITSATYTDEKEEKVLATLFHQGAVIEIDKKSGKTRTVIEGLSAPHSVQKFGNSFMISDTNANRILLLNLKDTVIKEIYGDFKWVQDARPLTNGNFIVADANNNRILEINSRGAIVDEFHHSRNFKLFNVIEIKHLQSREKFKEVGTTGVFLTYTSANYETSMELLRQRGLRALTYQEALALLVKNLDLKEELKGKKWFYLADQSGTQLSGFYTINEHEELVPKRGNAEETLFAWKGSRPLSLGVHADDNQRIKERRFVLVANYTGDAVAPAVVGVKIGTNVISFKTGKPK